MSQDDLLLQDEIDALLSSVSGEPDSADNGKGEVRIRPFDPTTQHRIIRERLHALDIINERFARHFRISLFNLIRRNADITVEPVRYVSYSTFSRNVPVPTNINLVSMKPLRGSALVVFPPNLVFLVVDNLFGGDGRFVTRSEGREFTNTEQRIIRRLLQLATESYQEAWQSVYPLKVEFLRSEMQVKFANITNSPNEVVVNTTFHLEVGNLASAFQICIPYTMIEPIRDRLTNPITDSNLKGDTSWVQRMASEIRQTEVEVVADFTRIPMRISDVLSMKSGDILPVELPDVITASVDGVPVMECTYGRLEEQLALRVTRMIDHAPASPEMMAANISRASTQKTEESEDDE